MFVCIRTCSCNALCAVLVKFVCHCIEKILILIMVVCRVEGPDAKKTTCYDIDVEVVRTL